MNEFLDALMWFSVGSSLTFSFCMFITRSEHREWSQLTDRLIAVLEKMQAEANDADWWKNSNEKVDNED